VTPRRLGALLCLTLAIPIGAFAQPAPPGRQPADGVEYVIEPIGAGPRAAFALRCRNGTMHCAYDWTTLCDGKPAINPDADGRYSGTTTYSAVGDKPVRVFVCVAAPRMPSGTALIILAMAMSFQACTDLHPHLRSDLDEAYRRVQGANASLPWPPVTSSGSAATMDASLRAHYNEATCRQMTVEPPPVIPVR
jgi:hypothetical protein